MEHSYLLIDSDSGNVASDYQTEVQALDALRALAESDGRDVIEHYLLMKVDHAGE